jgi:class 3 adenylate cyclase
MASGSPLASRKINLKERGINISLEVMSRYLPATIVNYLGNSISQQSLLSPPFKHSFETVILFADVSGFTIMSEKLSPEDLAKHLKTYFDLLVKTIAGAGGDVVKFAGDAMIVLWPPGSEDTQKMVRRAAQCSLDIQEGLFKTAVDENITLSVKLGIGVGNCSIVHVGGVFGRVEYLAVGNSLVQAFLAEHKAQAGQVVASPEAWKLMKDFFEASRVEEHGYAFIKKCIKPMKRIGVKKMIEQKNESKLDEAMMISCLKNYIPSALIPHVNNEEERWASERRTLSVVFVNLGFSSDEFNRISSDNSARSLERIQNVILAVQEAVYMYEGSLNKCLMDDKGSTLIAVFGLAPLAHDDDAIRAVLSALMICSRLGELELTPSLGITTGPAFCGIVGAMSRREFSILGSTVNLSARLMQFATKHKSGIVCDENTYNAARSRLSFRSLKAISCKGFQGKIPIFQPYPKVLSKSPVMHRSAMLFSKDDLNIQEVPALESPKSHSFVVKSRRQMSLTSTAVTDEVSNELVQKKQSDLSHSFESSDMNDHGILRIHDTQVQEYIGQHRLIHALHELRKKKKAAAKKSADSKGFKLFKRITGENTLLGSRQSQLSSIMYNIQVNFGAASASSVNFEMSGNRNSEQVRQMAVTMLQSRKAISDLKNPGEFELIIHGTSISVTCDLEITLFEMLKLILHYKTKSTQVIELDLILKSRDFKVPMQYLIRSAIVTLCTRNKGSEIVIVGEMGFGKSHLIHTEVIADWPVPIYGAAASPFEQYAYLQAWKQIFVPLIDDLMELDGFLANAKSDKKSDLRSLRRKYLEQKFPKESETGLISVLNLVLDLEFTNELEIELLSNSDQVILCQQLLVDILRGMLAKTSFIIFIDDAQYMDSTSWAFLQFLRDKFRNEGLLFVIATRPLNESYFIGHIPPETERSYQHILHNQSNVIIEMEKLSDSETLGIALKEVGVWKFEDMLSNIILKKSNGNPRICKELVRTLIVQEMIVVRKKENMCFMTKKFIDPEWIPVPPMIQSLLASRIDRLDHISKMILRVASVVGDEFDVKLVKDSYPIPKETHLELFDSCFLNLCKLGLIEITGSFHDEQKTFFLYGFKFGFMREVVYNRLLKNQLEIIQKIVKTNKDRIAAYGKKQPRHSLNAEDDSDVILRSNFRAKWTGFDDPADSASWIKAQCTIENSNELKLYELSEDNVVGSLIFTISLKNIFIDLLEIEEFEEHMKEQFQNEFNMSDVLRIQMPSSEKKEKNLCILPYSSQDLEQWHLLLLSISNTPLNKKQ